MVEASRKAITASQSFAEACLKSAEAAARRGARQIVKSLVWAGISDAVDDRQITVEECERICDTLLERLPGVSDTVFLWTEAWLALGDHLGKSNLMLSPRFPQELDTPEKEIARIREAMYGLLNRHSADSSECMKAFDKINERRP